MSTLSLVIPFKVTFMGLLEKGPRAIKGSRKYPTALEVPQSWYTLPPTITPGLYTIEVPIQQYRPTVSFFQSDLTNVRFDSPLQRSEIEVVDMAEIRMRCLRRRCEVVVDECSVVMTGFVLSVCDLLVFALPNSDAPYDSDIFLTIQCFAPAFPFPEPQREGRSVVVPV